MNRVALIGCGAIAESGHLPTLLRHPQFALAAVCDSKPFRAERLAEQGGGSGAYSDWRTLLDREDIDAAVLALPPSESPDVAIECLRRGIAVLDEKPLAGTIREGRRVARAVVEFGGVYQLGFVLRYGDWVRELGRLARLLGTPLRIRVAVYDERLDRSDHDHLSRIQGFLRHSSAINHEGSHVIDYAGLWSPAPWVRVHASAERTSPDFAGPNVWHVLVDLADGSTVNVEIGWLLPDVLLPAVELEGPNGRVEFNPLTGAGRWRIGDERAPLTLPPLAPEWNRQYDAFAHAIERGRADVATVDDGLRALEITSACEASARRGTTIARSEFFTTMSEIRETEEE